jgi:hypothetical protein
MAIKNKNKGFTLIETIVYAAGIVLILGAISAFLFYMYDWYRNVTIVPRIDRIGVSMVDRISREVRTGATINTSESDFSTSTGSITFTTSPTPTATTTYFGLENGRIAYKINGGATEYISPSDITITSLYLTNASSPQSSYIKIDMTITYNLKGQVQNRTYSGLAILRQSYQ